MSTMIKLISALLVMNIFMYVAVNFSISADGENQLNEDFNFYFKGDLVDTFMGGRHNLDTITQNTKEGWTSYGIELNGTFTTVPDQEGGTSVGVGGMSFLDGLKIIYSFILTLGNVIISPLTLFFNFRMPFFVGLLFGIPYFGVLALTFFAFIAGRE